MNLSWVLPNQKLSPSSHSAINGLWIAFGVLCWSIAPIPFLPRPHEVYVAIGEAWNVDNLEGHLLTSLKLNLESLLWGTLISLSIAYLSTIGIFRFPAVVTSKMRFVSLAGLLFAFVLMTKDGWQLKVWLLTWSIIVFFVTSMLDVIASIPQEQYDLARSLKMNDWQILYEVVILGQADKAFDCLIQNAAMGWMMMSMVEVVAASDGGIGYLLGAVAAKHFMMPLVFGLQLIIISLGILQDVTLKWIKQQFCPWAEVKRR